MNPYEQTEGVRPELKVQMQAHTCESDGMVYTSNPPQMKCKHCGVFKRMEESKPITWNN